MTVQCSPDKRTSSVHELKVRLEGTKPPMWRRLVAPADVSLGSLYDVLQVAFGRQGAHLHAFEDRSGGRYARPGDFGVAAFDEEKAALADVLPRTGVRMGCTYDFGDDWLHRITVEEVRPAVKGEGEFALCTGGRRAMPAAEDLGGGWGLADLMQRYEAGGRPRPTVFRHGGEEWGEYDGPHDEVLTRLYEEDFDPSAFGPAEVTRALAEVRLRRAAGTRGTGPGERSGRRVPAGMYLCDCGGLHPLPGDVGDRQAEEQSLSDLFEAADVRLPGEPELPGAVREVSVFMAAMRLGHWCGSGRELTPKGLLRPKLARQAMEAELRRFDPEEWGDPNDRTARLASMRSAGDMELVDLPWEWALNCGFVDVEGNRAYAGKELPDDDAELLAAWQGAVAGAAVEISLTFPALEGPLGRLTRLRALTDEAPPLVFLTLLAAYGPPGGEWLDVGHYLTGGLEGLPEGPARQMVSALLAEQYDDTTATLELFGAAEWEDDRTLTHGALTLLLDGGGRDPLPVSRFRLTPLGRSGLRTLLAGAGIPAPVIGSLAGADARELLDALPSYPGEAGAAAEVRGRSAAVQVVDACDGTEAADALRCHEAPRVPATVPEAEEAGRAKAVLRKAAVSQVTGCSHAAASKLRRIGEPAEGQAAWGLERMLVDGALPFARRGEQAPRERLLAGLETGPRPLDQVAERADDLWRAGHPHAGEVLGALADAVKPVDKALAKRLRKAAFKVGSAT
ncbi:hypothetical protein [Streptomyces sp. NPDC087437]|uniref:IS1096 element passenger TnpR family protein n=1 Tax=Streptomyces sp. NPDC087437 TaxID=3365789 RepID=UPI00380FBADC